MLCAGDLVSWAHVATGLPLSEGEDFLPVACQIGLMEALLRSCCCLSLELRRKIWKWEISNRVQRRSGSKNDYTN